MEEDKGPSDEPATDKLAAVLRDCLLGLIALGMIGWLAYFGITAIATGHLDLGHSARLYRRWFHKPLDGGPAVMAGFSFLCLALAFASICMSHPFLTSRAPAWAKSAYWWFFAGWAVLYFTARFISGA